MLDDHCTKVDQLINLDVECIQSWSTTIKSLEWVRITILMAKMEERNKNIENPQKSKTVTTKRQTTKSIE